MALPAPVASTLNPNAPHFVPACFLAAEDFSPEWWKLVRTSPGFREYWLHERFRCEDEDIELSAEDLRDLDVDDDADDLEFVFDDGVDKDEEYACALENLEQNSLVTAAADLGDTKVCDVKSEILEA